MPENCAAIVIAAKHHELSKVKDTRGTTHTVGALRCKFQFRTNDWLNAAKTAMFCNGDATLHPEVIDNAISVPLDVDDECAVPYEVLTDTLPYSIGVWGITPSGLRVVSGWLVFRTQRGCYSQGNAPGDPDITIYEEILLASNEAVQIANSVLERANNGEFNGADGYTPYIGDNDHWWIGENDTGVKAVGEDGVGISKVELSDDNEFIISTTDGATKNIGRINIEKSDTNGHIKVGNKEIVVYAHPDKHTVAEISDFDAKIKEYKYATTEELNNTNNKFANYVSTSTYENDKNVIEGELNDRYTKQEAEEKFVIKGEEKDEIPDVIELVTGTGLVEPIATEDGAIYTDENNVIYTW